MTFVILFLLKGRQFLNWIVLREVRDSGRKRWLKGL
jgi:hypothetical protein